MPFTSRELSVLAYANGFTLWHYRSTDPLEALTAGKESFGRGYFDSAGEMLRSGDQIIANLVDGERIAVVHLAVTAVDRTGSVSVSVIGSSAEHPKTETATAA